jgi:hypothetical protein
MEKIQTPQRSQQQNKNISLPSEKPENDRAPVSLVAFLCDSKNKPPAMQGEGRSLDISNLLC